MSWSAAFIGNESMNDTNSSETGNILRKCLGEIDTLSPTEQWVFIGVASAIFIFNMFLVKRRSGGRFGVPTPLDYLLLADNRRRSMYCVAFGASTAGMFNIIIGSVAITDGDVVVAIILKILSLGLVALLYYPIFLSITTASSVIGSATGLIYSCSLVAVKVVFLTECPSVTFLLVIVAGNGPGLICMLGVVVYFAFHLAQEFQNGLVDGNWTIEPREVHPILERDEDIWQVEYVRCLFAPTTPPVEEGSFTCTLQCKARVNNSKHPFRYSVRMLAPLLVSSLLVYWLCVFGAAFYIVLQDSVLAKVPAVFQPWINWPLVSFFVGAVLAALISFTQIYYIAAHYRRDILSLYKGTHSSQKKKRVPVAKLRFKPMKQDRFTTFAGYQTAMIVMGFVYQLLVLFVVCMLVSYFFVLAQVETADVAFKFFIKFATPFIAGFVIYVVQLTLVFFFFMENFGKDSLIVNNRRLYNNFAYFLYFWNLLLGLLKALLRVVASFFISSIMMSRLSRTVVPHDFEDFDFAHQTYLSFIKMENELTNPSLVVFCRFLLGVDGREGGRSSWPGSGTGAGELRSQYLVRSYGATSRPASGLAEQTHRVSRRARNRWLVAVTMIRNPGVVRYRRGNGDDDEAADFKVAVVQSIRAAAPIDQEPRYEPSPAVFSAFSTSDDDTETLVSPA